MKIKKNWLSVGGTCSSKAPLSPVFSTRQLAAEAAVNGHVFCFKRRIEWDTTGPVFCSVCDHDRASPDLISWRATILVALAR